MATEQGQFAKQAQTWHWWVCVLLPWRAAEAIRLGAEIVDDLVAENAKLKQQLAEGRNR